MLRARWPDSVLIARVLAGRADAFEGLVLRHQRRAHAIARAHGVPASAVEDVSQEAFLKAFRNLQGLHDAAKFGPWFVAIARNVARRFHREGNTADNAGEEIVQTPAPATPSLEDRIAVDELRARFRRRVAELPEGIREAIFLYYYENRSVAQAASALGTTRTAVKKRLQKGRDLLREELWRELRDDLRELLPSARGWEKRARAMALLAAATVAPTAGNGLATAAGTGAAVSSTGSSFKSVSMAGGLAMNAKRWFLLGVLVLCLGGAGIAVHEMMRDEPAEVSIPRADVPPPAEPAVEPSPVVEAPPVAPPADDETSPPLIVRVVGADGTLLENATLRALIDRDRSVDRWKRVSPRSTGEFAIEEAAGKNVLLVAEEPRHLPKVEEIDGATNAEAAGEPVVVELAPADVLRLRIVSPADGFQPLSGVTVGAVRGYVSRTEDKPRFGHVSSLKSGPAPELAWTVTSDAEGMVEVRCRPGDLWIEHVGYAPTALKLYDGPSYDFETVYSIPLYRPTTLRVRVRRADGIPVERFELGIGASTSYGASYEGTFEGSQHEMSLRTACGLQPPPWVPKELSVSATVGELDAEVRLPVAYGGENEVEIVLQARRFVLQGRVVDAVERPVDGALVVAGSSKSVWCYVTNDEIDQVGPDRAGARTDPDGRYEITFADRPPSFYVLVDHDDHPFHISPRLRPDDERLEYDVRLTRPVRLEVALAPGLEAPAGAEIGLLNTGRPEFPVITYRRGAKTDARGVARFDRVAAGSWTLSSLVGNQAIFLREGREYRFELGAKPVGAKPEGVDFSGIASADGVPVAGFKLVLRDGRTGQRHSSATTDEAGGFLFTDVPPGHHSLAVGSGTEFPLRYITVHVEPGAPPFELDLTRTAIRGRVLTAEGPLGGATVKPYTRQPIEGQDTLIAYQRAQTAPDGTFEVKGIYQTPVLFEFSADGYRPVRRRWAPSHLPEEELEDVLLEPLADDGRVRFRIVDAESGEEIPQALVNVNEIDLDARLGAGYIHRKTLAEELATGTLLPGRYRAFVRAGDLIATRYANEILEFDHDGTSREVTVQCRPGGTIHVELATEEGLVPTVEVEAFDKGGRALPNWRGTDRLTVSGVAPLSGLPAGPVRVRVTAPGWKPLEFTQEVETGKTAQVVKMLERE